MKISFRIEGVKHEEYVQIAEYVESGVGAGHKKRDLPGQNSGIGKIPYFEIADGKINGNPLMYSINIIPIDAEFTDGGVGQRNAMNGLTELLTRLDGKT